MSTWRIAICRVEETEVWPDPCPIPCAMVSDRSRCLNFLGSMSSLKNLSNFSSCLMMVFVDTVKVHGSARNRALGKYLLLLF